MIYMHTSPSGKSYIGQTKHLANRNKSHRAGSKCTAFDRAIKKYGWDRFTTTILAEGLSLDEANKLEKDLIKLHNTTKPNGYNLRSGGSNGTHSDETIQRMSKAHKGKVISPEARQKMAEAKRGVKLCADHREKIRNTLVGRSVSESTREKIASSLKGHVVSQETRDKISATKRKKSEEKKAAQGGLQTDLLI